MRDINSYNSAVRSIPLPAEFKYQIKHIPIKRIFDIVFSFLVLVFCLPLYFAIALLVRFSSPGKIVYPQERIGRGGKPFPCYKFRTMYADADQRLNVLLRSNPKLRQEWEKSFKLKKDPRVTPIGSFLRKTSLDEFPQFFNILKGDLSVVGPRPVVQAEVSKFLGPKAPKILSIRPGLTGLWQISGRSDTSYETRVMLDEKYVDSQSLMLDMKVIAKTIPAIIFSRGAY